MSQRWQSDDIWTSARQADQDVRAAYREHAKRRPAGPVCDMDEAGWARARPDHLAPFWCPCGGVWHVRRHYDNHRCESR